MNKKILCGLDPKTYEHPFDKKALDILEGTPGLEYLTKKFFEYGVEHMMKVRYTGSNIKVTSRNFPELYNTFSEVCEILYLQEKPDLYVGWQYEINAMTSGVTKPILVLFSGCIDLLEKEELMYVIGHEIGHIKSNHVLYHQMAAVLPMLGQLIGSATLGIGGLVSKGIEIALLNWQRMSEFTADRAGLLACQNIDAASRAMIKLAGLPQKYFSSNIVKEFIEQAREFEGYDLNKMDKIAKIFSTMWQNHPWTVMRASEFFKWTDTGEYNRILNNNFIKGSGIRRVA